MPHLPYPFCRPDVVRVKDGIPAFAWRRMPDFINKSFHLQKFSLRRGFCRIEMNMVLGTEVILELPAMPCGLIKAQERFPTGDARSEGTHVLRFLDALARNIHRVFIRIY